MQNLSRLGVVRVDHHMQSVRLVSSDNADIIQRQFPTALTK